MIKSQVHFFVKAITLEKDKMINSLSEQLEYQSKSF